jgi:hypothetical protein
VRDTGQNSVSQRENIDRVFTQRRNAQHDNVEPVEQLLAESTSRDLRGQIAVGRGNDPNVDRERILAPDTLEGLFVEEA